MKRAISIVTIVLATVAASGCCGGLDGLLHHPFGPNTICEPVHRAHYDNGFEVGYGSECSHCGLGHGVAPGAAPVCSCQKYGVDASGGCLTCALSGDRVVPQKAGSTSQPTKATRIAKNKHGIKQVSYTTGCTECTKCTECVESDPCCGGCDKVDCCCCTPRCPEVCATCYHPGPLGWVYMLLHPEKYYGGCGEVYWGDFHSYPPDCCDPCNQCGQWTGVSCCPCTGGCGHKSCPGSCCESYRCDSCGDTCGEPTECCQASSSVEGPMLLSQTDRVVRPTESRVAKAKSSTSKVKRR